MRVRHVPLLAEWSSAMGKRLALLKSQRIPIRFACIVLAIVLLQVILLIILFRILIQEEKGPLPTFPETLSVIIHLRI